MMPRQPETKYLVVGMQCSDRHEVSMRDHSAPRGGPTSRDLVRCAELSAYEAKNRPTMLQEKVKGANAASRCMPPMKAA